MGGFSCAHGLGEFCTWALLCAAPFDCTQGILPFRRLFSSLKQFKFGLVVQSIVLHPAHRPDISQTLDQPPPSSVLGLAMKAWMMLYRHLSYPVAAHFKQGRKEAVHAAI